MTSYRQITKPHSHTYSPYSLLEGRRYNAASLTSWILLRGLYPRVNTGTFIHRGIKESVVYERYAEKTYRSHEAQEQNSVDYELVHEESLATYTLIRTPYQSLGLSRYVGMCRCKKHQFRYAVCG